MTDRFLDEKREMLRQEFSRHGIENIHSPHLVVAYYSEKQGMKHGHKTIFDLQTTPAPVVRDVLRQAFDKSAVPAALASVEDVRVNVSFINDLNKDTATPQSWPKATAPVYNINSYGAPVGSDGRFPLPDPKEKLREYYENSFAKYAPAA